MTQIPKIDQATEDRLKSSLGEISQLVDGGMLPNDALYKVATEQRIPAGQVRLLANAYNTGRTQYQLHTSEDPLEKVASFPLADADQVLAKIYPEQVKTAAQVALDESVSSDYDVSPGLLIPAWKHALAVPIAFQKAASATKEAPAESETAHYHRIGDMYERALKKADDAKSLEVRLTYETADLIEKLAAYFQTPTALSFPAVRSNSEQFFGKAAETLFDELLEHNHHLAKRPAEKHRVDWNVAPYSLVNEIMQKSAAHTQASRDLQLAEEEMSLSKRAYFNPFPGRSPRTATTRGSILDQLSSPTEKAAAVPSTAMSFGAGAALSSAVKGLVETLMPPKEDMIRGQLTKMQDPGHEENIRAIRTQTMLTDLMRNDPVIKGYQPDQVYDAFNRISEVAPQAAQSSMVAKALVRRYLEQSNNIDPFEVDQMLNVENKLRSQQQGQPARPGPVSVK